MQLNRVKTSCGWSIALLLAVVLSIGCSREEQGGIVTGKVSYKGKPLDVGTIVFHPATGGGQLCHSLIQKDGTFKLQNQVKSEMIPPGSYVAVVFADNTSIAAMKEDPLYPVQPTVPFKFSSPTTSPLKYDVVIGENNFDVNLDSHK
jgi:hypothetical protein